MKGVRDKLARNPFLLMGAVMATWGATIWVGLNVVMPIHGLVCNRTPIDSWADALAYWTAIIIVVSVSAILMILFLALTIGRGKRNGE